MGIVGEKWPERILEMKVELIQRESQWGSRFGKFNYEHKTGESLVNGSESGFGVQKGLVSIIALPLARVPTWSRY